MIANVGNNLFFNIDNFWQEDIIVKSNVWP